MDLRVLARAPPGPRESPCSLGEVDDLLGVERDQRHRVGPAVAVHHGLGDPARLLEVVLDVGRREVLAARGDDDVLLAAGDGEVAVLVERAEVAGVQPAVVDRAEGWRRRSCSSRRRCAGRWIRISPSSAILTSQPGSARPTVPSLWSLDRRGGGDRGGLRHPVALEHRHAAGVEELEDLLGDRRGAGGGLLELAAEDVADVLEQLPRRPCRRRPAARRGPPGRRPAAPRTFRPSWPRP